MNGDQARIAPHTLFWVGASRRDLRAFPPDVRQVMGYALWQAQCGEKHIDAKPLKGFGGARVIEIVGDFEWSAFRTVYSVKFAGAVYVLHAFQKKSKKGIKTPQHEIELVKKRLKAAQEHYENWS